MKLPSLKTLAVLLLVFPAVTLYAQIDPISAYNRHVIENWQNDYVKIGQYRVKGSPYLLGESFVGDINFASGTKINGMKILYDLYTQKVGIETDGKLMGSEEDVNEFVIHLPEKYGAEKLVFKNSAAYNDPKLKTFLNVLAEGEKVSLLKTYRTKLVSDPADMYTKDLKLFEQYYEYYLFDASSKKLTKVKLREKDILSFLDQQKAKEILAGESMNLTTEAGVKRLVNKYNGTL